MQKKKGLVEKGWYSPSDDCDLFLDSIFTIDNSLICFKVHNLNICHLTTHHLFFGGLGTKSPATHLDLLVNGPSNTNDNLPPHTPLSHQFHLLCLKSNKRRLKILWWPCLIVYHINTSFFSGAFIHFIYLFWNKKGFELYTSTLEVEELSNKLSKNLIIQI